MNIFIFSHHSSCTQSAPACPSWPGLKAGLCKLQFYCQSDVHSKVLYAHSKQRPDRRAEYGQSVAEPATSLLSSAVWLHSAIPVFGSMEK